jgi:hypothetical protein
MPENRRDSAIPRLGWNWLEFQPRSWQIQYPEMAIASGGRFRQARDRATARDSSDREPLLNNTSRLPKCVSQKDIRPFFAHRAHLRTRLRRDCFGRGDPRPIAVAPALDAGKRCLHASTGDMGDLAQPSL